MTGRRYPNLFIAGVAKGATTTWYETLGQHPEVFMPEVKEPRFMDPDLTYTHAIEDETDYLALYEDATPQHERLGDASPWYLYSKVAPQRILDRVDDPKVLISLRHPVDRLYSRHSQGVLTGNESIESFEAALEASQDRKQGKRLPDRMNPREALYYWDVAHYAPHVERWLAAFDADQIRVLRFDDFVEDPQAAYADVCRFLGIDDTFEPEIGRSNPNQEVKSHRFRDLVREPPDAVLSITQHLPVSWRETLRELLKSLNRRQTERDPLDPELRQRLVDHCRPDVERLEEMLGWDLADWKR